MCGPASSGRTSLAFSLLGQATERQEAGAFVDVSDSLDPLSLAAAGGTSAIALDSLPRIGGWRAGSEGIRLVCSGREGRNKNAGLGSASKKPVQMHGWRHPRELMRGVEKAIPSIVGKQTVVTESAQSMWSPAAPENT